MATSSVTPLPRSFHIDETRFRPGQRAAYIKTVDLIRQGQQYVSVVLPTRYGKSDYMRITGLRLLRDRLVSGVLMMAPDRILRNQLLSDDKVNKCWRFYGVNVPPKTIETVILEDSSQMWQLNNGHFIAVTTHLIAGRNRRLFEDWVRSMKTRFGVPPVVFVDEAHTGSNENTWGQAMGALANAGAFVILCTATPFRSDGRPIPGFTVEKVDERTISRTERIGDYLRPLSATSTTYRLRPDHITTFRDAWTERPSPICDVSHQTFDVFLKEFFSGDDARLSQLTDVHIRQVLRTELRKRHIVREACQLFVKEMELRQGEAPETSGIIFVGNDDPIDGEDRETDAHARAVQDILQDLAPKLRVAVATSNVDNPEETISAFAEGRYNVLIAKQMAARGVDIDRLKVELDLSNVRTRAAFIQRLMRVATRWDRPGKQSVMTCTYIGPDDRLSLDLYDGLVRDSGGDVEQRMLSEWEFLGNDFETGNGGNGYEETPTEYEAISTGYGATLRDASGAEAPGDVIGPVNELLDRRKDLIPVIGKAELGTTINEVAELLIEQRGEGAVDRREPAPPTTPQDLGNMTRNKTAEHKELRRECNELADKLTKRLLESHGQYNSKDAYNDAYKEEKKDTWNHHKDMAGVSPALPLSKIPAEKLRQIIENMKEEWGNG